MTDDLNDIVPVTFELSPARAGWIGMTIRAGDAEARVSCSDVYDPFPDIVRMMQQVVAGLAVSAPAAFALAVIPFRGRSAVFTVVVLSFLVPFEAIAIPLSRTFSEWNLTNTLVALILPGLGNGLAVFTLRQFFLGIPPSLAEVAHVDGASWPRIFWSVYLPLTRPAMIGAGLMARLASADGRSAPPGPSKRRARRQRRAGPGFAGASSTTSTTICRSPLSPRRSGCGRRRVADGSRSTRPVR